MKSFYIVMSITFLLIFSACKKEPITNSPNSDISINLNSPFENENIAFGDPLHMDGEIIGQKVLFGYKIELINTTNDSILYNKSITENANHYSIHEHWINYFNEATSVLLKIDVYIDNNGNKTTKEMNLLCLP